MATRADFIKRQHDEVRAALDKLRQHAAALEEKVQEGEKAAEKWGPLLAEAALGVEKLTPVLADFDAVGVDPEELVQYAQVIEDWQRKELEIAKKLA